MRAHDKGFLKPPLPVNKTMRQMGRLNCWSIPFFGAWYKIWKSSMWAVLRWVSEGEQGNSRRLGYAWNWLHKQASKKTNKQTS